MTSSIISCEVLKAGSNDPLPSVFHNGQRYIVAEAGVEFLVRVKMNNATAQEHKVSLKIDGQDVGYSKVMHAQYHTSEATFEGYLQQQARNRGPSVYRAFKFGACKPAEDAATVEHLEEIKAGKIDVMCDVVVVTGYSDPNQPTGKAVVVGDEAAKKKLPEGKKWFLAPGLKAEAGRTVTSNVTWNYNVYTPVSSLPPLKLHYDTAENLMLRKILIPSNPAHRPILRTSANPRIASLGEDPSEAVSRVSRPAAVGGATGSGRQGIKREGAAAAAGIKRERGEEDDTVPRSATAEKMDLTGEMQQGPLMVNGQAVGADENAVCDLCDSDDEPSWQVQKKQAIELGAEL